jgi:hypothetical protein
VPLEPCNLTVMLRGPVRGASRATPDESPSKGRVAGEVAAPRAATVLGGPRTSTVGSTVAPRPSDCGSPAVVAPERTGAAAGAAGLSSTASLVACCIECMATASPVKRPSKVARDDARTNVHPLRQTRKLRSTSHRSTSLRNRARRAAVSSPRLESPHRMPDRLRDIAAAQHPTRRPQRPRRRATRQKRACPGPPLDARPTRRIWGLRRLCEPGLLRGPRGPTHGHLPRANVTNRRGLCHAGDAVRVGHLPRGAIVADASDAGLRGAFGVSDASANRAS